MERDSARPFNPEFYFKKGTTAEQIWLDSAGEELSDFAKTEPSGEGKVFGGLAGAPALQAEEFSTLNLASRRTDADADTVDATKGSVAPNCRTLNRALDRTLYLVVSSDADGQEQRWRFPQVPVQEDMLLHQAAESLLENEFGAQMDTWIVGRVPVGHFVGNKKGGMEKVFFMKGHYLTGNVQLQNRNVKSYAWLTKEELEHILPKDYYNS
ncbi:54S ribosomal protein L17 mitochondrial, partial [Quaeritorhiza haematococci]